MSSAFAVSRSTAEPFDPPWEHAACVPVTEPFRERQQLAILTTMHPGAHSRVKREFRNALEAIHGVQNAEVNLEKHSATVEYENGKVSVDELTRVINQLGYKAGVPAPAQSQ